MNSAADSWTTKSKLAVACFAIFLAFWVGQTLAGRQTYNNEQRQHGEQQVGLVEYLGSGHFFEATTENWESEFLQMGAMVLLTVYLIQKGSAESKQEGEDPRDEDPRAHRDDPGAPWPVRRGGVWLGLYEHSLLIAFIVLFSLSVLGHAWSGAKEYSSEERAHGGQAIGAVQFMGTSEFWFQSFQNWQSEFLAVGAITVLTIFLRERGSAESKPVHAPIGRTGDE